VKLSRLGYPRILEMIPVEAQIAQAPMEKVLGARIGRWNKYRVAEAENQLDINMN
jgi:hypothetical protein